MRGFILCFPFLFYFLFLNLISVGWYDLEVLFFFSRYSCILFLIFFFCLPSFRVNLAANASRSEFVFSRTRKDQAMETLACALLTVIASFLLPLEGWWAWFGKRWLCFHAEVTWMCVCVHGPGKPLESRCCGKNDLPSMQHDFFDAFHAYVHQNSPFNFTFF